MKEHGHLGCVGVLETIHGSVVQLGPQVTTMAQTEWLVGKHDGGGVLAFLLWNFTASIAHESGPSAVTGAMASMMHGRTSSVPVTEICF